MLLALLALCLGTAGGAGAGGWDPQAGWAAALGELDRSLGALNTPPRFDKHSLANWKPTKSVLVLGGRAYVAEAWLKDIHKNQMHLAFLASVYAMRADAPDNVAYNFHESADGAPSTGGGHANERWPPLVIAKKMGFRDPGVLIPNPYFSRYTGLRKWDEAMAGLKEAAKRPWAARLPKAFWRGGIRNYDAHKDGTERHRHPRYDYPTDPALCPADGGMESGNWARLSAASVSVTHPESVDIKCTHRDVCAPTNTTNACHARTDLETRVAANPSLINADEFVPWANYTRYRYLVNLPGESSGSYSQNLNHLWACGSVVVFWRAKFVEWLFPALREGVTHVAADQHTLVDVVKGLEADPARAAALVAAAGRVHETFVAPSRIAEFTVQALRRAKRHFNQSALDDACWIKHEIREGRLKCESGGHPGFGGGLVEMRLRDRTVPLRRAPGCELLYKHAAELCRSPTKTLPDEHDSPALAPGHRWRQKCAELAADPAKCTTRGQDLYGWEMCPKACPGPHGAKCRDCACGCDEWGAPSEAMDGHPLGGFFHSPQAKKAKRAWTKRRKKNGKTKCKTKQEARFDFSC